LLVTIASLKNQGNWISSTHWHDYRINIRFEELKKAEFRILSDPSSSAAEVSPDIISSD